MAQQHARLQSPKTESTHDIYIGSHQSIDETHRNILAFGVSSLVAIHVSRL